MDELSLFSYRPGNSIIHKMPSWLKILFIPVFNIVLFMLDWKIAAACILLQIIVFLLIGFSVTEQLKDLKPLLYYAVFLYVMNIFMEVNGMMTAMSNAAASAPVPAAFSFSGFLSACKIILINAFTDKKTAFFCVKFCACVQSCSLMFKTSTSIEIRTGIEQIEILIRRCIPFVKKEPQFALAVSLLVNFIPTVFKIWNQLKRAWLARGGKASLGMVLVLIPQLFSVGLKFSFDTTRALINRGQKI